MPLKRNTAVRHHEDHVVDAAYLNRRIAVAAQRRNGGHEVVVWHIDGGKMACRRDIPADIAFIQWKSNTQVFVVTREFQLCEFSLTKQKLKEGEDPKPAEMQITKLESEEANRMKLWTMTSGAISVCKGDNSIYVAIAMTQEKDIIGTAIENAKTLNKRKKNTHTQDDDEEEVEEDDGFIPEHIVSVWKLNKQREIVSHTTYRELHSESINTMKFYNEMILLTGGGDGLLNVVNVWEMDEDDALQTTVTCESSLMKVGLLKDDHIYAVTDDNKQLVMKVNSEDDIDIVHKRNALPECFLIDVCSPTETEKPVVAIESRPDGELCMYGYDYNGKNSEVLVRTYEYKGMIRFVASHGNIVCCVTENNFWSAFNMTKKDMQVEDKREREITEEEQKCHARPFKRDFSEGHGGFGQKKVFKAKGHYGDSYSSEDNVNGYGGNEKSESADGGLVDQRSAFQKFKAAATKSYSENNNYADGGQNEERGGRGGFRGGRGRGFGDRGGRGGGFHGGRSGYNGGDSGDRGDYGSGRGGNRGGFRGGRGGSGAKYQGDKSTGGVDQGAAYREYLKANPHAAPQTERKNFAQKKFYGGPSFQKKSSTLGGGRFKPY